MADDLVVKDSNGTPLKDGDSVTLTKDLKVKGANTTLKRGTLVKGICLTDNPAKSSAAPSRSKDRFCGQSFSRRRECQIAASMIRDVAKNKGPRSRGPFFELSWRFAAGMRRKRVRISRE